jgi:hypothetical protein
MPKPRPLALERLEDRYAPSTSGIAWPDNQHLTLSFVPDGTQVGNSTSNLFRTLNTVAPTATWEREILRAFETWAASANLNVGVVADGGQPLGTTGAVQGDPRFGDIRIAAVPLAPGTLVTNTSFQWSGTTWSGDLVVNSSYLFSIGSKAGAFDLYTAMLNEAGNVFGVLDSRTDTASGVYYQYTGVKTGLDANDVSDIHSLYGARSPDSYDFAPNDTLATATNLGLPLGGVSLQADINNPADADNYKVTVPLLTPAVVGLTVKVTTSGLSTLTPTLQVYDANKRLVASATATDPLKGDLTVQVGGGLLGILTQLLGGSTYTIRVAGGVPSGAGSSGTPFAVGSYQLDIGYQLADGTVLSLVNGLLTPVGLGGALYDVETGLNDTLTSALTLPSHLVNGQKPDARFDYAGRSSISSPSDVDYYKVQAPSVAAGPQKMNVLVWALQPNGLRPRVDVFDAAQHPVASKLLANENGTYTVEVANVTAGATYSVRVGALYPSGSHSTGSYYLGVDFTTQPPTALQSFTSGTIGDPTTQQSQAMTVGQNQLFEFLLAADAGPSGAWEQVQMDIYDSGGALIFSLSTYSGQPAGSGHVYLRAGTYTVRFSAAAKPGTPFVPVDYTLSGRTISDPIGPQPAGGKSEPTTKDSQQPDDWSGSTTQTAGTTTWDQPYYW